MVAYSRSLLLAFAVLSIFLTPHGASAKHARKTIAPAPLEYDFEGAKLGMSLDDLRAMPLPRMAQGDKPTKLYCSSDDLSDNNSMTLSEDNLDQWRKDSGAIVCEYDQRPVEDPASSYNSADRLAPNGEEIAVLYYFVPDPQSKIQSLYGIEVSSNDNGLSSLLSGLVQRFGKATESGDCSAAWHNQLSSICLSRGFYFTENRLDAFVHRIPNYYESYGRP